MSRKYDFSKNEKKNETAVLKWKEGFGDRMVG
jgi:hypothetical protein